MSDKSFSRNFIELPEDIRLEIIYYSNPRYCSRLFSTCKSFYQFWASKQVPSKPNEFIWFNFCQQLKLCPPPIVYSKYFEYGYMLTEDDIEKIELPKGCSSWYQCCVERFRRSLECVSCKYEHIGQKKALTHVQTGCMIQHREYCQNCNEGIVSRGCYNLKQNIRGFGHLTNYSHPGPFITKTVGALCKKPVDEICRTCHFHLSVYFLDYK